MKYNESLQKAGVLPGLDGLHPPSMGACVTFSGGKANVTDGPFAEAKEMIGGYWMIQVKSKEEALEWASRCPGSDNEVIEFRQVLEMSDFPADVRAMGSVRDKACCENSSVRKIIAELSISALVVRRMNEGSSKPD
jgi:hypothetical protein